MHWPVDKNVDLQKLNTVFPLGQGFPASRIWCLMVSEVELIIEIKGAINVTCLNHPETIPPPLWVRGKVVFPEISAWCQKGWRQLLQGSGLGFINSVSTATFRTPVTRISCKLVAHGNSYDVTEMGDVWTTFERSDSAWEWSQDLNLNSDQWTICVLLGQRGCL